MNKRGILIAGALPLLSLLLVALMLVGASAQEERAGPASAAAQSASDGLRRPLSQQPSLAVNAAVPRAVEPDVFIYGSWELGPEAPFSYKRFDAEFFTPTNKIYFLGGRLPSEVLDSSVWVFDPVTRVFTDTGADMPQPSSNYQVATIVDHTAMPGLYIVSGYDPAQSDYTDAVQVYYPHNNTTAEITSDPYPGNIGGESCAPGATVAVGNKLYALGCSDVGVEYDPQVWIYDPAQTAGSRWAAGPAMNLGRAYMMATVVDDVIYALGGDVLGANQALSATAKTEMLDASLPSPTWDDAGIAEMPMPCDEAQAFGFSPAASYDLAGSIVIAGCGQWPDETRDSMLYDMATDTWDMAFPDLNEVRRNHAGAFVPLGEGAPGSGLPGLWIFGGLQGSDSNVLEQSEFYGVTPLGDVTLLPSYQRLVGESGQWLDFTMGVANRSGAADSYTITHVSDLGWAIVAPTTVGPVPDNDTVTFTLSVSLPVDAECFEVTQVVVTATSETSAVVSDTADIEAQAGGAWRQESNAGAVPVHWPAYVCSDDYGAEGTCFYFGGLTDYPTQTVTNRTQIYDIASDTWSQGAPLPTPVFAGVAGLISGTTPAVYVVGGFDGDGFDSVTDALQVYDPATDQWYAGPPAPIGRGSGAGGVIGGKFYFVGGQDADNAAYAVNHEFTPGPTITQGTWMTKSVIGLGYFPTFPGYAVAGGKLYVGGDYGGERTFVEYDPTADIWAERLDIPAEAGRKAPVMAGYGDYVFLYGGDQGSWQAVQDSTWVWYPLQNLWAQSTARLRTPTTGAGGGFANERLWSFGGSAGSGALVPAPHESTQPCLPPPPPVGALQGTVYDANTSLPIENAYIYVFEVDGYMDPDAENYDDHTDAGGSYYLASVVEGAYTATARAQGFFFEGYYAGAERVDIISGTISTLNFTLTAPYMEVGTSGISEMAEQGGTRTYTFTLDNNGTRDLFYYITEYPGDQPDPVIPDLELDVNLAAAPGGQRVDPQLYQELAESPNGETSFLIVMNAYPDLSPAYEIRDWEERGQYVLDALRQTVAKSQAALRADLEQQGVTYESLAIVNGLRVTGDLKLLNRVAARSDVAWVRANHAIPGPQPLQSISTSEPQAPSSPNAVEWNISLINADDVWAMGYDGAGIVVANIDTGVQHDHPALRHHYRGCTDPPSCFTYDHDHNWWDPYDQSPTVPADVDGHGTHTMGTMVGDDVLHVNQVGVAPGATWFTCDGGDDASGSLWEMELIECAEFILAPWDLNMQNPDPALRAHAVNNSWGGGQRDGWFTRALAAWRAAGIFPAFSAGNSGPECVTTGDPGDGPLAFATGATDIDDEIAGFSSRGPAYGTEDRLKPQVSAPGVNVRSSVSTPPNGYDSLGGTSMASPHSAGTVALIWSAAPSYKGDIAATEWLLERTAVPLTTTQTCGNDAVGDVPNHVFGWGRIDALAAVQTAISDTLDIPWLNVTPVSGTVSIAGSDVISVTVDTSVFTLSESYAGHLWLQSNDPYEPQRLIPVEFAWYNLYMPVIMKNF